jgi:hypothetical protein
MYRQCDYEPCAREAHAYVLNDFGRYGWYCKGHIELFEHQARNRAAVAAFFQRIITLTQPIPSWVSLAAGAILAVLSFWGRL